MPMDRPSTSPEVQRRFDDLAEDLAGAGAALGTMFGVPTIKVGGKALASLWGDALVLKLPPSALDDALTLQGAAAFDPMGGRPMKEWVVVPVAHASRWRGLADEALAYVAGQAAAGR